MVQDSMRFVAGLNLMQAIRTVAFHKNDVSVPFFIVNTSCFPSMNKQERDLEICENDCVMFGLKN